MAASADIHDVEYVGSYMDWEKAPNDSLPQYAFVGRSNVGKSSLINMLTNRIKNKIAYVSKSPGKTQTINFYKVNDAWYLVDLPGYGYAKSSKRLRKKWRKLMLDYLSNSPSLVCTFVLIDSRIPPQKNDMEFINKLGENEVPLAIIYTKTDKMKLGKLNNNIRNIQDEFLKNWEHMPDEFISSSVTKEGREEILNFIHKLNEDL